MESNRMHDHDGCCGGDEPIVPSPARRSVLFGAALLSVPPLAAQAQTVSSSTNSALLQIATTARQSSTLIGRTQRGADVMVDNLAVQPDAMGRFIVGFDRDAPAQSTVSVRTRDGQTARTTIQVSPRTYVVRRVSGLPGRTVNPPASEATRIQRESTLKQRAFASVDDREMGFLEAFNWPLASIRVTSPWGAQRSLNGELQRPHYGIDLGGATGTPIRSPAPGIVIMAESDMFYEGGMVTLDHGQGLMTTYLHMSRIDVRVGQRLARGVQLGHIGARGRATGPHLCWRMRWRDRHLDPTLKLQQ
jgi:murein DD-endopeptidase MepM/ murein hydrolase activator NlpD